MISISNRIVSGLLAGAASGLLVAAATPAAATNKPKTEVTEQGNSAAAATNTDTPKPAKQRRYCIVNTVTGSMLPIKVCKTRAEWADEGVDIPVR